MLLGYYWPAVQPRAWPKVKVFSEMCKLGFEMCDEVGPYPLVTYATTTGVSWLNVLGVTDTAFGTTSSLPERKGCCQQKELRPQSE